MVQNTNLVLLDQCKSFDGMMKQFSHFSTSTQCTMKFCIYLPPNSETTSVPVIYYLAGLTGDETSAMTKTGVQRIASERGVAIVSCDTSPRGVNIEGEDDSWDFGLAAGYYLDATEPKWSRHYNMYSYVTKELPTVINANFPVIEGSQSIMGHSMGGHGALVLAFKNPNMYKSVSAFAPICHPTQSPWGIKAFTGYLGSNEEEWKEYDSTELMKSKGPFKNLKVLVDQGTVDGSYKSKQLLPEDLVDACKDKGQDIQFRLHEGYEHSSYFIASFMEYHVHYHADALMKE